MKNTNKKYYVKQSFLYGPASLLMILDVLERFEKYEECAKIKSALEDIIPGFDSNTSMANIVCETRVQYSNICIAAKTEPTEKGWANFKTNMMGYGFGIISEVYGEETVNELCEQYPI